MHRWKGSILVQLVNQADTCASVKRASQPCLLIIFSASQPLSRVVGSRHIVAYSLTVYHFLCAKTRFCRPQSRSATPRPSSHAAFIIASTSNSALARHSNHQPRQRPLLRSNNPQNFCGNSHSLYGWISSLSLPTPPSRPLRRRHLPPSSLVADSPSYRHLLPTPRFERHTLAQLPDRNQLQRWRLNVSIKNSQTWDGTFLYGPTATDNLSFPHRISLAAVLARQIPEQESTNVLQ